LYVIAFDLTISNEIFFGVNTNYWYFYKNNFMARNTSILLGEHFEEFISTKISSGKYSSASEVIRTALRLLEAEESKIKDINKFLSQGEKSGLEKSFDPKTHLKKLHSKYL
jgi:antitoxin ParD1/3/4